jgi:predicted nucleic acid-binding protein
MRTVFLDTVGLLALLEQRDQWHARASEAMDRLRTEGVRTATTSAILLECGNAATRKPYRADVERLRSELKASGRLIVPTTADEDLAWRQYRDGAVGEASIVDHLSFVVMRGLNITDAFTNDRHFNAAGFNTLF